MAGTVETRLVRDDSVTLLIVSDLVITACKDGERHMMMMVGSIRNDIDTSNNNE